MIKISHRLTRVTDDENWRGFSDERGIKAVLMTYATVEKEFPKSLPNFSNNEHAIQVCSKGVHLTI